MSTLNEITWTAHTIAESINQRIDRGTIQGDYLLAHDIPPRAVEEFQRVWNSGMPQVREQEFIRLYQAITAGF